MVEPVGTDLESEFDIDMIDGTRDVELYALIEPLPSTKTD